MVEHRPLNDIIAYAILTLGIFIVAFPVYLAFIASTHDAATVVGGNMPLTPGSHTLDNYYRAIFVGGSRTSREPVGHMLMNSFISAIGIALGKIFISILSAYAVVYFRFPFRKTAFWIIFVTLMLPVEVRIYPTYKVVADLGICSTHMAGLIMPLIASATGTLLFRQFFMTIPEELLEASRIDGAGPIPVLQGYAAAAVGDDDGGAVRDPVHLWLESISVAASHHDAGFDADHRHRHQEDADDDGRTRRMAACDGDRGAGDAAAGGDCHAVVRGLHAAPVRARGGVWSRRSRSKRIDGKRRH